MTILNPDGSLKDPFRNYIVLSRYARWLEEEGRRETWAETVDRYMNFMRGHLAEKFAYEIPADTYAEVREAIREMEVLPSMRALMTAGPALQRENMAAFNCSYLPIADLAAFHEILYILMCGTGVGFSVEHRYISQLPAVAEIFETPETVIVVEDSKEGWAIAYRELLRSMWIEGKQPGWDLSLIRPAGARLKTFGGRASGPGPLAELFAYTAELLWEAQGRQLTSLEVHDLACKIASVVVVGGVRRSAMISLSDLEDTDMAKAKSGEWWTVAPHRSLANNSAVIYDSLTREQFDKEWDNLVASGSGERGLINRDALRRTASRWGRRNPNIEYGVNPCSEIVMRPYGLCNLSEVVVQSRDTHEDLLRKARIAAILGTWQSTLTKFNTDILRPEWTKNAEDERLLGVSQTGIVNSPAFVAAGQGDPWSWAELEDLRDAVRWVNLNLADEIGIPASAAATCVKPSGTASSAAGVSAGIHAYHAPYYLRTVRADEKDPLAALMIDAGIPHERDVMQPSNWVFTFPMRAPKGALTRKDMTAIEHLELWLAFQKYWCEHKPSITVSVRGAKVTDPGPFPEDLALRLIAHALTLEDKVTLMRMAGDNPALLKGYDPDKGDALSFMRSLVSYTYEWDEVREWVWEHRADLSGVSFLPFSDHTYKQAPYQEVTKEEYEAAVAAMPSVRWADLSFYEFDDMTTGSQEYACSAAGCDVQ
ncbi:hypothetical protein [Nonomuraea sp. SYSU D8015]|uniref:hypothetical protein n=1 Tax=Nonomuraea sp. SYSU D8015 TaxID=2593644 RepID=UPI0016616ABF|nr:hypothetical protein [Nonomuraea sp. SYSU D8015]